VRAGKHVMGESNRRRTIGTSERTCPSVSSMRTRESGTSRGCVPAGAVRRLDHGLRVEITAKGAPVERVGQRHQGHPLVMRHVFLDNGQLLVLRNAGLRIIKRFIITVAALGAVALKVRKFSAAATGRASRPGPSHKGPRRGLAKARVLNPGPGRRNCCTGR